MAALPLFSAFGVELEYMLVDAATLDVRPVCDELLRAEAGALVSDVERGPVTWSNELALHVIELKTSGPAASLAPLPELFVENVQRINELATPGRVRLLPTGMHPWMDPHRELRLWPHDNGPIYEAFHRIFDCRGHGWANLQSVHLNLPFCGDEEFGRLHAAVRLILPLLPALAASSPVMEGRVTGLLDTRLEVYRTNARRLHSVTGRVIPEPAYTRDEYDRLIFQPMFDEIAPLDPEGVLQEEFLNARGAIARFSRGTIEIRLLDVQECPEADVALCAAIVAVLQRLVEQRWTSTAEQQQVPIAPLEAFLIRTIAAGEQTVLDDPDFLRHFGAADLAGGTVGDLWRHLIGEACREDRELDQRWGATLDALLKRGPLARAIRRRLGPPSDASHLEAVYRELAESLAAGRLFGV